jgi:hypothetical protein
MHVQTASQKTRLRAPPHLHVAVPCVEACLPQQVVAGVQLIAEGKVKVEEVGHLCEQHQEVVQGGSVEELGAEGDDLRRVPAGRGQIVTCSQGLISVE